MKKISLLLPLLLLVGCYKIELGGELTEPAEVDDTIYMPANHGSGTGFDGKGRLTFTDVDIPAKYAVVFKCQHGKFSIEDSRGQELYKQLSRGDQVIIHYQEKFKVDTKAGTRELIGLHFVSAEKVKE